MFRDISDFKNQQINGAKGKENFLINIKNSVLNFKNWVL